MLWGIATACTAAVKDYPTLLACRVCIGIFEACAVPSLMLIIGRWYDKSEQAPRYAFWYCGLGAGQIIGGLLSFGFQNATNSSLQSWRMMFVVLGSITVLLGIVSLLLLPESPSTAKFLSDTEKTMLLQHLSTDRVDKSQSGFDRRELLHTFKDPQIWLLFLMTVLVRDHTRLSLPHSYSSRKANFHHSRASLPALSPHTPLPSSGTSAIHQRLRHCSICPLV